MTRVYVGLGSNIEPEVNICKAMQLLESKVDLLKISPFYRGPALGEAQGQDDFVNGVVMFKTTMTADQLKFEVLRPIEAQLGRINNMPKYLPRTMDLDLILFGDQVIPELNIPEPEISKRVFI